MVVEYETINSPLHQSIGGLRFVATGYDLPEGDGQYTLYGKWNYQPKYKKYQLKVSSSSLYVPRQRQAIIRYLSSLEYIGPEIAKRIYETYGLRSLDILEKKPIRLLDVQGASREVLFRIYKEAKESSMNRELADLLSSYGIPQTKMKAIRETYGDEAVPIIQNDVFALAAVPGFTYAGIDKLARQLQAPLNTLLRVESGITAAMLWFGRYGHLFVDKDLALNKAYEILNNGLPNDTISRLFLRDTINLMVSNKELHHQNGFLYLARYYIAENEAAKNLVDRIRAGVQNKNRFDSLDELLEKSQAKFSLCLSDQQQESIIVATKSPVCAIVGGPGTGKTTLLKILIDIFLQGADPRSIILCAPTGKAARRMSQTTHLPATTIHHLLKLHADRNEHVEALDPKIQLVILDEASMVDMILMNQLLQAVPNTAQIVMLGDTQQLSSINPGNVLQEITESGVVPIVRLETVYRQNNNSKIIVNANKIACGDSSLEEDANDFQMIEVNSEDSALAIILEIFKREAHTYGLSETQILCPVKNALVGTESINNLLQKALSHTQGTSFRSRGKHFQVGDKVIQVKNTDKVNNGDIGMVLSIQRHPEKKKQLQLKVIFENQDIVEYNRDNIDELELAFSITVHKSQGSEFQSVIIPLFDSYNGMLQRNLLYTAITRSKKRVFLIGQKSAIRTAITHKSGHRNTWLAKRLIYYFGHSGAN